jgi:hypothetical protein
MSGLDVAQWQSAHLPCVRPPEFRFSNYRQASLEHKSGNGKWPVGDGDMHLNHLQAPLPSVSGGKVKAGLECLCILPWGGYWGVFACVSLLSTRNHS